MNKDTHYQIAFDCSYFDSPVNYGPATGGVTYPRRNQQDRDTTPITLIRTHAEQAKSSKERGTNNETNYPGYVIIMG